MIRLWAAILVGLAVMWPSDSRAMDLVKYYVTFTKDDPLSRFHIDLYDAVLQATKADFGPFETRQVVRNASQNRDLLELEEGDVVNVDIVAARPQWENKTIPIRIPLLKGMLGMRLFLIRSDKAQQFAEVRSLQDLKALRMGLGRTWAITQALTREGFNISTSSVYDGLFRMLEHDHFDYFPRGLNEIFIELEALQDDYPDMIVEPTLALEMPLPSFFFVSPAAPGLARRIRIGLERIMANGVYEQLFDEHYGSIYRRARLDERRIFRVSNPELSLATQQILK